MRRPTLPLRMERLEDRSTPAAVENIAPDRVLLALASTGEADSLRADRLAATAPAESVTPLGADLYRVDLRPGIGVLDAVGFYTAQPDVVAAAPDRIVTGASFNDPSLREQTSLAAIGAAAAWTRSAGTKSTVVAVIDTGIDYSHPDLVANLWTNTREVPGNGRDDDGNGYADDWIGYDFAANDADPSDHDGHGTHVAGIIGASGNNGIGISGVNPNTRIMVLKFIGTDGNGYTSDAIRALNYAAANGASVVNASWGSGIYDAVFATAIARAQASGLILVASAGNDSANNDVVPFFPANYTQTLENVVTVAATDVDGRLAGYSNYGASVTLAAPGNSILSTLPNNRYGSLSGTSMAAPFVSGALALLKDAHPDWSWRQLVGKLKSSVDPLAALAGRTATGGRLNLAAMLDVTAVPAPPTVPPPVSPPPPPPAAAREKDGARVISAIFHGTAADRFDRVRIVFNEKINAGSLTVADVALSGPGESFSATSVVPVSGTNNTQFDVSFAPRTAAGTYSITLGVDIFDIAANRMNQNGNGINGEPGDRFTGTGVLAARAVPAHPSIALPVAIPDMSTIEIPLVVDRDGTVSDVNLSLYIEHANVGDLTLRLRSPGGRIITLADRRGGTGSGYRGTTFDDEARSLISKAKSPFPDSFRPEESLSGFDGLQARGTWTLIISDRTTGKTGRITQVRLDIATTNVLAGSVRTLAFSDGTTPLRSETRLLLGMPSTAPSEPQISLDHFLGWLAEKGPNSRGTGLTSLVP